MLTHSRGFTKLFCENGTEPGRILVSNAFKFSGNTEECKFLQTLLEASLLFHKFSVCLIHSLSALKGEKKDNGHFRESE